MEIIHAKSSSADSEFSALNLPLCLTVIHYFTHIFKAKAKVHKLMMAFKSVTIYSPPPRLLYYLLCKFQISDHDIISDLHFWQLE